MPWLPWRSKKVPARKLTVESYPLSEMQRPFRDASHGRNVEAWDWPRNSPNYFMKCKRCQGKLKECDKLLTDRVHCLRCYLILQQLCRLLSETETSEKR